MRRRFWLVAMRTKPLRIQRKSPAPSVCLHERLHLGIRLLLNLRGLSHWLDRHLSLSHWHHLLRIIWINWHGLLKGDERLLRNLLIWMYHCLHDWSFFLFRRFLCVLTLDLGLFFLLSS